MIDLKTEKLMSVRDVARLLGIAEKTVRVWMLEGLRGVKLEHRKIGGSVRTSAEALDRFDKAVSAERQKDATAKS